MGLFSRKTKSLEELAKEVGITIGDPEEEKGYETSELKGAGQSEAEAKERLLKNAQQAGVTHISDVYPNIKPGARKKDMIYILSAKAYRPSEPQAA